MGTQDYVVVIGAIVTGIVSIVGAIFAGLANLHSKNAANQSTEAKQAAKALVDVTPDATVALEKRKESDGTTK